jgi:transcriptional regulator with XRE-family HTH domain
MEIPAAVAAELARLRAENARLLRMLELSPRQASPPGPAQVATRMGISIARVSQIERGDVSTQDVLNRYITALGGTLKLIADFGDDQLKIA